MKKILCYIILLLFFACEAIDAAIVSEYDGSTFVTKAEFDVLRFSFDKQIDNYYDSIDKKIDGAIAAYLSGISFLKEEKVDGFIPLIINLDLHGTEFHYGNGLGVTTQDPFSTSINICNPNIGIMGIFSQKNTADNYKVIQYLSHNPSGSGVGAGVWSSQWEGPNNGCLLAGFKEVQFGSNKYYGLTDDYQIKKWQFALTLCGMAENQGYDSSINTTYASNTWNFLYNMPTCENYNFNICGVDIGCSKGCVNKALNSYTYMQSRGGSYYEKSPNTITVYGWLKDEFYIYKVDSSKVKTETPISGALRRHKGRLSGASTVSDNQNTTSFSYKFYMPEKYAVTFDKLINLGATEVYGEPVYCYQGLPVVKIGEDYERVELKLNLTSCGSTTCSKCKVYIADKPFDNILVSSTVLDTKNILYKDTSFVALGNREIKINLPDGDARTLWLKIEPETRGTNYAVKVTVDSGEIKLYKPM